MTVFLRFSKVFCCIAIVAIAIIYFFGLWIRQIFSFPRRDLNVSSLPGPPRALSGNNALPVYGHTHLFTRHGGDAALYFSPTQREWHRFGRMLGDCFSMFIWGQWRVVIRGPERAKRVMDSMDLKESWPWTPPKTLLGASCLCLMEDEDEKEQLKSFIGPPLRHHNVVAYAPIFAEHAERCLEDVVAGKFQKKKDQQSAELPPSSRSLHRTFSSDDDLSLTWANHGGPQAYFKLKWDALRSYTFDLVDGPVLSMNHWLPKPEQSNGEPTQQVPDSENKKEPMGPSRDDMLLWMERMKRGIDVIKITFGPEWMYIWLMNEYGRAVNARNHMETVIHSHVEKLTDQVPVTHAPGHALHEPSTQPIPIWSWHENRLRSHENIFGAAHSGSSAAPPNRTRSHSGNVSLSRPRASSMPMVMPPRDSDHEDEDPIVVSEYVEPYRTEQDLCRPRLDKSPLRSRQPSVPPEVTAIPPFIDSPPSSDDRHIRFAEKSSIELPEMLPRQARTFSDQTEQSIDTNISLLEHILRQQDLTGIGISQAVTTEISILLWLMMEVGNAWTAMALNLLANDVQACSLVQEELDSLETEYGSKELFYPEVLEKMKYLDALLYESIRLCPENLGGLKETTKTIVIPEAGVQVAKGSQVVFCQPTEQKFDIASAVGMRPELLGRKYPCVEL